MHQDLLVAAGRPNVERMPEVFRKHKTNKKRKDAMAKFVDKLAKDVNRALERVVLTILINTRKKIRSYARSSSQPPRS